MGIPAIGALCKLGMGASTPVTEPYEFVAESLRATQTIVDGAGLRGTRSHASERTRAGTIAVAGSLQLHPSPQELANLLPRILGGSPSGQNYGLAETLPDFSVAIDRQTKVFTYAGCKVIRATFRAAEGQLLELVLDLVGKTETVGSAGSFPAIAADTNPPFVFMDCSLSLLAALRKPKSFELVIENIAQADRFLNSPTLTDIPIVDRRVSLRCQLPYTPGTGANGEEDLYGMSTTGAAATLALANGGYSLTFNLGNVQFANRSPVVGGRGEVLLQLDGVARKAGSTPELAVVLDATA